MVVEQRPFEVLQRSIGKTVIVRLKGNNIMRGILKSYDQPHLNLYLDNAVLVKSGEEPEEEQIGQVILRGDNVLMVSPP